MPAPSGFKQKCPACAAPVLIGNPRLIGRKIECPNCRHSFLVEKPDSRTGGNQASAGPGPRGAIRRPPAVAAKSAPPVDEDDIDWDADDEDEEEPDFVVSQGKVAQEEEDEEDEEDEDEDDDEDEEDEDEDEEEDDEDDEEDEEEDENESENDEDEEEDEEDENEEDDEDEEDEDEEDEDEDEELEDEEAASARTSAFAPLPEQDKKGSKVLKVGAALAAVAVLALGAGGYVLFSGPGKPTSRGPVADAGTPIKPRAVDEVVKPPEDPKDNGKPPAPPVDVGVLVADVSNLLPADTEAVLDVSVERLLRTPFRLAAFDTPNAFVADSFRRTFGFPLDDVSRIVTAGSQAGGWVFSVVRTGRPVKKETLDAHLRLVPGGKVGDLEYHLIGRPLDDLSNLLLKVDIPRGPLALHVMDSRTLVVADLAPLTKFLEERGGPAPVPAPAAPPPAGDAPPAPAAAPAPAAPQGSFRTIAPGLRAILDEMEKAPMFGETVLLREAVSGPSAFQLLRLAAEQFDQRWNARGDLVRLVRKQVGTSPAAGGLCLLALGETKLSLGLVAQLPNEDAAKETVQQIAATLPPFIKGAGLDLARDLRPNRVARDGPPLIGAAQGEDGTWSAWSNGLSAAFAVRLVLAESHYQAILGWLGQLMVKARFHAEMAETRPRLRELAEAIQAHVQDRGSFPRGALDRPATAGHPIAWRPDQRLSWLVDLLPYLPSGDYISLGVDHDVGWNEGANLLVGQLPVPAFLSAVRSADPNWRWVMHWGQSWPLAATHYVGITGVGLDAAEYRADDPATAAKLGVFGYDRVTRPAEIKDGKSGTIVAVQVPVEGARPWMAGGGSTVRGVSEDDDCVRPFVCLDYRGRRGTFALMADGKVRFIPADIPPATFRALCTIAGGEPVPDLDKVAPVVDPDDADGLTVDAPPAPADESRTVQASAADLALLQGDWQLVHQEANGKPVPADLVRKVLLTVRGDAFVLRTPRPGETPKPATLKLDASKKPRWIDLTDAETRTVTSGIYEVAANELKVCLPPPDGAAGRRPEGFDSTSATLMTFRRQIDRDLLDEMEKLRSTWDLVSGSVNGLPLPAEVLENSRLVIDGNDYSLTVSGRTDDGILVLDVKHTRGDLEVVTAAGRVLHGQYAAQKDWAELTLCIASPGAERPKNVEGGLGLQVLTFRRAAKP